LPDAIDLLIELGQLRRAYTDLQSNYLLYQMDTDIMLRNAVDEAVGSITEEKEYWRTAYGQDNVWYKSFWFGVAVGVVGAAGSIYLARQLK
jgi:hypothetical protein